jgi:hypothetical protein
MADKKGKSLELRPDPKNANKGTGRGRFMVDQSLREYGAGRSILADKNGVVIAGNKTLEAAKQAGLKIKEIHTDGKELVAVVRDDLDLANDPEARELAYADNRSSEVGLDWDKEQLIEDMDAAVELGKFWNEMELREILEEEEEKTADVMDGPPQMELQPLESYDYVLVLARNTMDFAALCHALDIGAVQIEPGAGKKKIGLGRCVSADRVLQKLGVNQ